MIGLCAVGAGVQLQQFAGRLAVWEQRREAVPAFGQAQVVYFAEPTCPACLRSAPVIRALQRRYPRYRIARVDASSPAGIALQEEYYLAYGVPDQDRGRIPVAFAGKRSFVGAEAIITALPAYLKATPAAMLAPPASQITHGRPGDRRHTPGAALLAKRFAGLDVLPVLIAGAVDSINPCAIATLIFLLSFLTAGGRRRSDLLWIGGVFTLGVYLTYFLIGLGLLRALHSLSAIPWLARCLYPAAALMTLALAVLSFHDGCRARRGQTARMLLQLPRSLKLLVHRVIRTQLGLRHLMLAAFGTSVLISALEFTCTSQVYLPTLMYMAQTGSQRPRAIALLMLYNLMFVLPLIGIFTAAHAGVSSRALARLAARHTTTVKLVMGLLFLGFTLYLAAVGARLWSAL